MRRRRASRGRFDDRGQMAGIEALPFGFLVLVAGALLLANAWSVVDAKLAVSAAAREAVRAYVESGSQLDAELVALNAVRSSVSAHGRDPAGVSLWLDSAPGFGRCQPVTAEVVLRVDSVSLPFIGGFARLFEVRATHREIIDPYRSGMAGRATCNG
jgi:hypothetical protein